MSDGTGNENRTEGVPDETPRITDDELRAIEARAAAATPGPWSAADEHGNWPKADPAWCVSRMDGDDYLYDVFYHASQSDGAQAERDSEFAAHARTDVPRLLAEVAALTAQRDAAQAVIGRVKGVLRGCEAALVTVAREGLVAPHTTEVVSGIAEELTAALAGASPVPKENDHA